MSRWHPRPHKNVSNVLSLEALVASSPVTQRHLDFGLFDIYTLDGKSRRTAWSQSSSN